MVARSTRRKLALALVACTPLVSGGLAMRADFDSRILAAHNRERDAAGVEPLQWDPQLAASARTWAAFLSRTGRFEHSPDGPGIRPEGENLWAGSAGHYQPEAMVALWAAEKQDFVQGTFPNNSKSGRVQDVSHYTQLIWGDTRFVGCAISSGVEEDVLVCRYSSPGNVLGQRPI